MAASDKQNDSKPRNMGPWSPVNRNYAKPFSKSARKIPNWH